MYNIDPVTLGLIIANVLFSMKGFSDYSFFEKYKFNISAVRRGEHIRNITSGFLHVDQMHLMFNMLTLYFFAPAVIGAFNGNILKFLCVYIVSLLLGSLLTLVIRRNEPYYSAVGASGAVVGIIYAAICLNPGLQIGFIFLPGIDIPGYIFGIVYLLYSIYGMKNRVGNIGHTAHFGGAIGGFLSTLLIEPSVIEEHPLTLILLAIPIVILFILEKLGKI